MTDTKQRLCAHTGKPLPPNLYNDMRKRAGKYRYKRPDGTFKLVTGTYAAAVKQAEAANKLASESPARSGTIRFWAERYIKDAERQNPGLRDKASWSNRKRALLKFADEFAKVPMREVTVKRLQVWWDAMTYDAQHHRRAAFSAFFDWALARSAARCNPFANVEGTQRLIEKKKPAKQRVALHIDEFWQVYDCAEDWVQRAMLISLTTTMRGGDIVQLRFDSVIDGRLCRTIGKSLHQRGATRAASLSWDLDKHTRLRAAINSARETSVKFQACPYIIHKRRQGAGVKKRKCCDHKFQATRDDLSRGFMRAVRASGLWDNLRPGVRPPSFHEVRGLAIERLLASGATPEQVAFIAAHTDVAVTLGYAAGHAPEYLPVDVVVTDAMIAV